MAGDGVNDAPHWRMPMSASPWRTAADVAMEIAAVTLVHGDLRGIVLGAAAQRRHHAEYSAEHVLRVHLQFGWRSIAAEFCSHFPVCS